MKSILKFLPLLLIIACSKPTGNEAIQKEIADKKVELAKIQQEITLLESKLVADTTLQEDDARLVNMEVIQQKPFQHFIEVQGSLDGDNNVAVYPEAMGAVEEIYVKAGQGVTKGQIMARLNDAAAKEQINSLKTNLELATIMFDKIQKLWDQKIGSEVQYLQAKATKESLESQLASAQQQLKMLQITSPINGTVEDAPLKLGQSVSPGYPVFRVVSFGKLKVVTHVAEAYASKIKVGDDILVYLPDIKKEIPAKVTFTSNYINQVNRTYNVEANLSASDPNMKANMVAVVKITDYKNDAAIVLPISYVQKDQKGSFILVAIENGNKIIANRKQVTTGQIYNGMAEIIQGINPGDKVITTDYYDIEEGEAVRFN